MLTELEQWKHAAESMGKEQDYDADQVHPACPIVDECKGACEGSWCHGGTHFGTYTNHWERCAHWPASKKGDSRGR